MSINLTLSIKQNITTPLSVWKNEMQNFKLTLRKQKLDNFLLKKRKQNIKSNSFYFNSNTKFNSFKVTFKEMTNQQKINLLQNYTKLYFIDEQRRRINSYHPDFINLILNELFYNKNNIEYSICLIGIIVDYSSNPNKNMIDAFVNNNFCEFVYDIIITIINNNVELNNELNRYIENCFIVLGNIFLVSNGISELYKEKFFDLVLNIITKYNKLINTLLWMIRIYPLNNYSIYPVKIKKVISFIESVFQNKTIEIDDELIDNILNICLQISQADCESSINEMLFSNSLIENFITFIYEMVTNKEMNDNLMKYSIELFISYFLYHLNNNSKINISHKFIDFIDKTISYFKSCLFQDKKLILVNLITLAEIILYLCNDNQIQIYYANANIIKNLLNYYIHNFTLLEFVIDYFITMFQEHKVETIKIFIKQKGMDLINEQIEEYMSSTNISDDNTYDNKGGIIINKYLDLFLMTMIYIEDEMNYSNNRQNIQYEKIKCKLEQLAINQNKNISLKAIQCLNILLRNI